MTFSEERLLPIFLFSISACVDKLQELPIGDFIPVHPESRQCNRGLNESGRRARNPYHARRDDTIRLQCHLNLRTEGRNHLICCCKSLLDGPEPVVSPGWHLRKRHRCDANTLPLRQIITRCCSVIG